jgi:cytochrome bd-type quinol oxidase subunit 1
MDLDPVLLSRIQFAFVVSFHIIFPAFTIGMAAWLATIEGCGWRPATRSIGGSSTFG